LTGQAVSRRGHQARNVIAEQLGVDAGRITDEARLVDDLGADWLDRPELMMVIEDQFI